MAYTSRATTRVLKTARSFTHGHPPRLSPPHRPSTTHRPHSTAHTTSTSSSSSSSIDPTEVTHFNALASSWWDPHGPSRLLHLMNPLRHSFMNSCLAAAPPPPRSPRSSSSSAAASTTSPVQGLHYLDVGCGGGIFAESAARLPNTASVTGIDPSRLVLDVARAHARRDPLFAAASSSMSTSSHDSDTKTTKSTTTDIARQVLQYHPHSIESHPLPQEVGGEEEGRGGGYDIVTLFEVLEHVSSPSTFLSHLERHVRPGGWLVLSTIARTWTSWLTTKVMAEGVLRVVPWGTHEWGKYVNVGEVEGWFLGRGGGNEGGKWEMPRAMGVVYVPGVGWREVKGAEEWGNYFFGVRRRVE